MQYYVRDTKGRVAGPFSVEAIKKAADEGRILPSWHLSSTQEKWTLAAKVPDLFPASEIALPVEPPGDPPPRSVHEGPLAMFLDTFKGGKESFKNAWPWIQKTRLWWVKLTRPSKGFIVTEVGPRGVTRLRYDFANEQPAGVSEEEYEKELQAGIGRIDWYVAFALLVVVAEGIWALSDFGESPNPTLGVVKLVAIPVLLVLGYVYQAKRSKVFIGYVLSPEIDAKLNELRNAFSALSRCSRVWALRVKATDQHWKYGVSSQISHLPAANFGRPLPNIQTNIRVCSVAFHQLAIYFLPEKLLVIDGNNVRHIAHSHLETSQDHVDYLHTGWQRHSDSLVIGYRWLHSRVDGGPDRRFNVNYQIPIVRLGILAVGVAGLSVGLITSNPAAPEAFRRGLPRL
jgi:hypothetical protein